LRMTESKTFPSKS